jgi:hypothetical protein
MESEPVGSLGFFIAFIDWLKPKVWIKNISPPVAMLRTSIESWLSVFGPFLTPNTAGATHDWFALQTENSGELITIETRVDYW